MATNFNVVAAFSELTTCGIAFLAFAGGTKKKGGSGHLTVTTKADLKKLMNVGSTVVSMTVRPSTEIGDGDR